jgi:hypothetical protein
MADGREVSENLAIWVMVFVMLFSGCATYEPTRQETVRTETVMTEYLLENAGFQKWPVYEDYTRERAALMRSIPKGQITTFRMNGSVYHVYNDEDSQTLYVGDELAYQRYLSLAQRGNVCRRVEGSSGEQFWACFQEYEQRKQQGLER